MGWFSSSEEIVEEKLVDTNGNVNNNIIIQEAKDTHQLATLGEQLLMATYVMVGLELVKLSICFYKLWHRNLKRKYVATNRTV